MPRRKSFTREKQRRRPSEIDAAIERYMPGPDRADEVVSKTGVDHQEARPLKKEASALRAIDQRMGATGETQMLLTDPDCLP